MMTCKSLRFEAFTLDLERLCLDGPPGQIDLRRKSFDVLRYLVEHAERVVTKEELIKAVWPDVTVGDESLTQCISEVRRALGEQSHRIIRGPCEGSAKQFYGLSVVDRAVRRDGTLKVGCSEICQDCRGIWLSVQ